VANAVEIQAVSGLTPNAVDSVRAIYEASFPERQREPFSDLLARPDWFDVARAGEDVLGFSFASELPEPWLFLEYMAVAPGHRDAGLGSSLWRSLIARVASEQRLVGIVLEVESPDAPEQEENTERLRRIEFYRRNGAVILPVADYAVPNVQGEGTEHMWLLSCAREPELHPDEGALERIVQALYSFGYGLQPDHELVRAACSSIGTPTGLHEGG
jgi:ribosomal protein S18 acetylase RimI-like enzyme